MEALCHFHINSFSSAFFFFFSIFQLIGDIKLFRVTRRRNSFQQFYIATFLLVNKNEGPKILSIDKDYSEKLFWGAIPYTKEGVAHAAHVHGKLQAPPIWSRCTTLVGFIGEDLETITF